VAIAAQAVFEAKSDADAVIALKGDPLVEIVRIAVARNAERGAVAALDAQRTEHGC